MVRQMNAAMFLLRPASSIIVHRNDHKAMVAVYHLVDAILPSPRALEDDLLSFKSILVNLKRFSRNRWRPLAELAADADMAPAWVLIRERISDRARDFHSIEEYANAHRQGDLQQCLSQWTKVKKARKRIVQETAQLGDILMGAQRHRYDEAELRRLPRCM